MNNNWLLLFCSGYPHNVIANSKVYWPGPKGCIMLCLLIIILDMFLLLLLRIVICISSPIMIMLKGCWRQSNEQVETCSPIVHGVGFAHNSNTTHLGLFQLTSYHVLFDSPPLKGNSSMQVKRLFIHACLLFWSWHLHFFSFFSVVGVTYGGTLSFVDDFENKICYFF